MSSVGGIHESISTIIVKTDLTGLVTTIVIIVFEILCKQFTPLGFVKSRLSFIVFYNMVCSALFLQRALYTVHCTNIMHSRKPSFVITPAVFS